MRVLMSMANNSSTPYFTRFADLARSDPEVDLRFLCLFPERPAMIDEMRARGLACDWIPFDSRHRKRDMPRACAATYRLLGRLKPDVVHTHLFDDSLPVLLAARLRGVRVRAISKLDAGFHFHYARRWVALDRLNNRNATHIVTVSTENRSFVIEQEHAPAAKVTLIHQGLPQGELACASASRKEELRQRFRIGSRRVALTVGRFVESKGCRHIVEAARIVSRAHPDVLFLFFGFGPQKAEVDRLVSREGLEMTVSVNDWIERQDLNCIWELADVYVHAAALEPFGFVLAEAMFKGVPIVSTRTGAALDALTHLENAYLVDRPAGEDLAAGILHVLNHDTRDWVTRARRRAEELFTVERMWASHLALYRSALASGRAS
jgi:glycosyltransferase involved in cell wall biosynthesis